MCRHIIAQYNIYTTSFESKNNNNKKPAPLLHDNNVTVVSLEKTGLAILINQLVYVSAFIDGDL